MADISACSDKKCPSRTICYRYLCVKGMWQSYSDFGRKKGQMRCEDFVDNAEVATICRCNLMGMEHKRTSSCDVFEQLTDIVAPKKQPKVCKRKK